MAVVRVCKNCGTTFDPPVCPECRKRTTAKYRAANKEKRRLALKKWRADNPEKTKAARDRSYASNPEASRARSRRWHREHPDLSRERSSRWHAKNKKKANSLSSQWKANHPDSVRIYNSNRRSRIKEIGGILSKGLTDKLFKLQRGKCACGCGQDLGKNYHLDHIMPIARGGTNTDDNMQLLTNMCNHQKHAKHPIDFMQSRGFLL